MASVCSVWIESAAITLTLHLPSGQRINLSRKPDELLSACLKRTALSVQKAELKQQKQQQSSKFDAAASLLDRHGDHIPVDTVLNRDAWQHGYELRILVSAERSLAWTVERDPPFVASLTLPELALASFPVVALVDIRFAHDAMCEWSKVDLTGDAMTVLQSDVLGGSGACASSVAYTPTAADVGHTLVLTVTPRGANPYRMGETMTASCAQRVVAVAPSVLAPIAARQAQLPARCQVRVVSYNVLWGLSSDSILKKGERWHRPATCAPSTPMRSLAELPVPIESAACMQRSFRPCSSPQIVRTCSPLLVTA